MPTNVYARPFQLALGLLLMAVFPAPGQTNSNRVFQVYAEKMFRQAQVKFQTDSNNLASASQFARASFEYADLATNETQRAEIAQAGIAAARQVLAREPQSAAGHYLLGMNLGELAQAEAPSLAAYRLVHEVEHEFKRAAELNDAIDFAGPARTLGLLYFQAPGWPLSVGNKHKAREWLERAVVRSPEFPENQLNLAEAYLKWRQKDESAKVLIEIETIWPAAKTNFTGEAHARDWRDWEVRRQSLRAEFRKIYKSLP